MGEDSSLAPPAYGDASDTNRDEILEDFYKLDLNQDTASGPTVDICLAHLKLLFAFESLRSRVADYDGLWNIWNSRAYKANPSALTRDGRAHDILAKLREKRWNIYIARAVDRYEAWWQSFVPRMLQEDDILGTSSTPVYGSFTSGNQSMCWTTEILPPLDVLLVWHAHMLNPRIYLEDCLRYGYATLWAGGMPWASINDIIDPSFHYAVGDQCQATWTLRTGRAWNNEDDVDIKKLKCVHCYEWNHVSWTTCGQEENDTSSRKPGLVGQGYGDGDFQLTCFHCGAVTNKDTLNVSKFVGDVTNLVSHGWPMPGTILNAEDGTPKKQQQDSSQLFPNRLIRQGILAEVLDILKPGGAERPSMMMVRDLIQNITRGTKYKHSTTELKQIDKDKSGLKASMAPHTLPLASRVHVRRMMSRYWENHSLFGLDLVGAVMRQTVFTKKMVKIDWLHSPTARLTMTKLLGKYDRFWEIAAEYPDGVLVPTLDIDLAWHTHQLSPQHYYRFTVAKTGAFTDHNDKIDEDKLGISFDWMSRTYQQKYGEVYSECLCWFCEALRFKHKPSSRWIPFSGLKRKSVAEDDSEVSKTSWPPIQESAHISSHPAVHAIQETNLNRRRQRQQFLDDLDDAYGKLLKEANKSFKNQSTSDPEKPMMGPRGQDACNYFGKDVLLVGPWRSETFAALTSEMYAAAPGVFHTKPGDPGVCAAGTCGGSKGCGSGAIAMCGAGCTGMGQNFFGAGCSGRGT